MKDEQFYKSTIFINAIVPLAMIGWDAYHHNLGANPIEFALHTTGTMTLIFLALSLSITPLRRIFGWHSLISYRRMFGLFAFFYGASHFLIYSGLDKSFSITKIGHDILHRQFIAIGMASFFLMMPLAITSTNKMIQRLGGKRWQKLHRCIYYVGIGGVLHYWMSVKADTNRPMIFAVIFGLLIGYRIFRARMSKPVVNSVNLSSR